MRFAPVLVALIYATLPACQHRQAGSPPIAQRNPRVLSDSATAGDTVPLPSGTSVTGAGGECADPFVLNTNLFLLNLRAGRIGVLRSPGDQGPPSAGEYRHLGVVFTGGLTFGTEAANTDISDDHVDIGMDPTGQFRSDFADTPVCSSTSALLLTGWKMTTAVLRPAPNSTNRVVPWTANLGVTEDIFSPTTDPQSAYVVFRYSFDNNGITPISGFWAGYYVDWELAFGTGTTEADMITEDAVLRTGIAREANRQAYHQLFAFIPIGPTSGRTFGRWVNNSEPPRRDYFFQILKNRTQAPKPGITGDVQALVGQGPYTIPPHSRVRSCFALVGGDDGERFQSNVAAARAAAIDLACFGSVVSP